MRYGPLLAVGFATAVGSIALAAFSPQSPVQAADAATVPQAATPGLQCNSAHVRKNAPQPPADDPLKGQKDPFKGPLVGADLPPALLPINDEDKKSIFAPDPPPLDPPCQEEVNTIGQEIVALDNLQRGFDFYSWRTFIALNSPLDGTPIDQAHADMPTRWEDMDNFKQLLDVMLPAKLQPPKWPTDRAAMEAERERLVPKECSALHLAKPKAKIIQMIEESYNEPFKTGPLIDQQGHYAIFDILMNRQMFEYIKDNHLTTKAGQAANSDLHIDFPAGDNSTKMFGAFMLKVSWKILSPEEVQAKNFHMIDALVLMPLLEDDPNAQRKCLPETLGLVGFHAVHKTVSRPQWIWTSFEHIKNVPAKDEFDTNKLDGPYNFFSVDCKDHCPVANATPPRPWAPVPALELKFRSDDSFKSQIVRETKLTNAAKNMNKIFQSMLQNSVWKNYMLISTQWPSVFDCTKLHEQGAVAPAPETDFLKQPDMTCSPAPTFLANSTLETYSQGEVPLASSSCIACHGNAVGFQRGASNPQPDKTNLSQSDFTFMLEKAQ